MAEDNADLCLVGLFSQSGFAYFVKLPIHLDVEKSERFLMFIKKSHLGGSNSNFYNAKLLLQILDD